MSGLCRDCRHWDRYDMADPGEWLGDCRLTAMRGQEPAHPKSKARAYVDDIFDDEEIPVEFRSASLQTVEDFGCNQFEAVGPD